MKKICLECFTIEELIDQIKAALTDKTEKSLGPISESLLSRKQAADKLQITLPTLNSWTKEKRLIAYRMGSRIYYKDLEIIQSLKEIDHKKFKNQSK